MIGKDKYQYLLSEIHELNRENLLIEQENNERIFNELHKISDKLKKRIELINSRFELNGNFGEFEKWIYTL